MRFCRGCRNNAQSPVVISNLVKVKDFAKFIVDNKAIRIRKNESLLENNVFLEKIFILFLEYQLMAQRQLSLYSSPFKEIPFFLFMRAWRAKQDLLGRLSSSLLQDESLSDKKGKEIPLSGITICGGEPLYQAENLIAFLKEIKKLCPFKIWLMTGFSYEDIIRYEELRELIALTDYIIDGPFMINKINLAHPFRGSTNQRIIDTSKSIRKNKLSLWHPQYEWTVIFNEYWNKFSKVKNIKKYNSFISAKEIILFLGKKEIISKINTVKEYERHFGDIRSSFVERVLN